MKSYKEKRVVLFYSSVQDKKIFFVQGFYKTDISILQDLGYSVILSNRISDFLCFKKYDIAFLYFYRYGLFPAIIAKLFRKTVIFTGGIDNLDKNYASNKNYWIQKLFFKLCNIFSDTSLIVSTADQENIKKIYAEGHIPKNNQLCFHSIDTQNLKYTGDVPKENIFLTIAWMEKVENVYRKGILHSIYVFKELLKFMPEYKFYIVGAQGTGSDIAMELVRKLNIADKIVFTGSIEESQKIILLKKSKFYFQLSEYEGFGIAATEALIAGNVIIHSGRGGLKDAVGTNGICIDELTDYQEIAKRIYNFCLEMQADKIIKKGIQYVESNFSYSKRKHVISNALDKV